MEPLLDDNLVVCRWKSICFKHHSTRKKARTLFMLTNTWEQTRSVAFEWVVINEMVECLDLLKPSLHICSVQFGLKHLIVKTLSKESYHGRYILLILQKL